MFDKQAQDLLSKSQDSGVFNQFVAPITTDNLRTKKDTVRRVLLFIFIIIILLAIGSVFLVKSLESTINFKQDQLQAYNNSSNVIQFEKNLPDMRDISQKLKLLNDVYTSKQYISGMFFPILGSLVESSRISYVYFNRISLKKDNNTNLMNISLSGIALDYPTLYRQVNNFKFGTYSNYIHNFKLQSFSMSQDMNVEFSIAFDIEINTPSYLKYIKSISGVVSSSTFTGSNSPGPLYDNKSNNLSNASVIDSSSSNEEQNINFVVSSGSESGPNNTTNNETSN